MFYLYLLIFSLCFPFSAMASGVTGSLNFDSLNIDLTPLFSVGMLLIAAGGMTLVFYAIAALFGWDAVEKYKSYQRSSMRRDMARKTRRVIHFHRYGKRN